MSLCRVCQRFAVYSFPDDPDGMRAYKLEVVEDGAGEGCEFCVLLLTTLKDDITISPYLPANSWIRLSFIRDSQTHGSGLRYNKLHVSLANHPFPKPRKVLSAIEGQGKEYELSVAADLGMSKFV